MADGQAASSPSKMKSRATDHGAIDDFIFSVKEWFFGAGDLNAIGLVKENKEKGKDSCIKNSSFQHIGRVSFLALFLLCGANHLFLSPPLLIRCLIQGQKIT